MSGQHGSNGLRSDGTSFRRGSGTCLPSAAQMGCAPTAGTGQRRLPGQYGSNGLRTDGTSFNVGNRLGERPSIRLFSHYNAGSAMDALLSQSEYSECRREDETQCEQRALPAAACVSEAPRARTLLDVEWAQGRLIQAVQANRARDVRAAVEDGADVNKGDDKGWTPLHVAAHAGKPRICELLVELGSVRRTAPPRAMAVCSRCSRSCCSRRVPPACSH